MSGADIASREIFQALSESRYSGPGKRNLAARQGSQTWRVLGLSADTVRTFVGGSDATAPSETSDVIPEGLDYALSS